MSTMILHNTYKNTHMERLIIRPCCLPARSHWEKKCDRFQIVPLPLATDRARLEVQNKRELIIFQICCPTLWKRENGGEGKKRWNEAAHEKEPIIMLTQRVPLTDDNV